MNLLINGDDENIDPWKIYKKVCNPQFHCKGTKNPRYMQIFERKNTLFYHFFFKNIISMILYKKF